MLKHTLVLYLHKRGVGVARRGLLGVSGFVGAHLPLQGTCVAEVDTGGRQNAVVFARKCPAGLKGQQPGPKQLGDSVPRHWPHVK